MRRYLPEWSKNSVILPIRDEETNELKYVDFSHGNAYDTATRPIQTLLNNIQDGIRDEKVLMSGVLNGMYEAAGELASPFISEAIYTQALVDLTLRGGKTREGKQIWTETQLATEPGTVVKNSIEHLAESMLPFSYPTLTRLYQAAADKPSKRGEFFELPDELWGFIGYRAVKLDPIKSMGFKLADYQRGIREARRLFTGGEEGLLKGGPKTPKQVLDRFIAANKAKFLVQQNLRKDLKAAQLLGTNRRKIEDEFDERQLGNVYFDIDRGLFEPYEPSENIEREFDQISQRIGQPNPYRIIFPAIRSFINRARGLRLDYNFDDYMRTEDFQGYLPEEQPTSQEPLPEQPMPAANLVGQVPQQLTTAQGLTPTELALLSPEEQQIRLRQRGLV